MQKTRTVLPSRQNFPSGGSSNPSLAVSCGDITAKLFYLSTKLQVASARLILPHSILNSYSTHSGAFFVLSTSRSNELRREVKRSFTQNYATNTHSAPLSPRLPERREFETLRRVVSPWETPQAKTIRSALTKLFRNALHSLLCAANSPTFHSDLGSGVFSFVARLCDFSK